jgi:DNA-binding NarL/FixJ family response regulator
MPPLRVLIADDQRLFADAMQTALSTDERVEVVGIASNGNEAFALTRDLRPDLVLMDLNMPSLDGLQATRRIREAGYPTPVIIVTGDDVLAARTEVMDAGAAAFVHKDQSLDDFMSVFFEVASLTAMLASQAH